MIKRNPDISGAKRKFQVPITLLIPPPFQPFQNRQEALAATVDTFTRTVEIEASDFEEAKMLAFIQVSKEYEEGQKDA